VLGVTTLLSTLTFAGLPKRTPVLPASV
jgi:hypothetical protein